MRGPPQEEGRAAPVALVRAVEEPLRSLADPRRALQERRYLKSASVHLGVSVPAIRQVAKQALRGYPGLTRADLLAAVAALWGSGVHGHRRCAIEFLEARVGLLTAADLALVEEWIREAGTWALVDDLAAAVAGALVERFPEAAAELDRWAGDPDFWVRRSALLALLLPLRHGGGDLARFGRYAEALLEEREFFIRKAIGWVLRDVGKGRPELVREWLLPRARRASGLTVREAVRHLPAADREAILAAREGDRKGRAAGR